MNISGVAEERDNLHISDNYKLFLIANKNLLKLSNQLNNVNIGIMVTAYQRV